MDDHDAAMLTFVKLAGVSQSREQLGPRDKFLVLAGVAASRANHPAVAHRCRRECVRVDDRDGTPHESDAGDAPEDDARQDVRGAQCTDGRA